MLSEEQMKEISNEINEFVDLTERNVTERSLSVPNMYNRILKIYTGLVAEMEALQIEHSRVVGNLYQDYREYRKTNRELSKAEIEEYYIKADDNVIKIKKKMAIVKSQSVYLENVLKNLNKMGFDIKNFIEIKKFYSGSY